MEIDFHVMTKQEMLEYALENYGERLDMRDTEVNMRHKIIDLFIEDYQSRFSEE